MQPYLFPYIGYFQLIKAVDLFVVHDDVQFIKGGWINRNKILVNNSDFMFTFSLKKDSSFLNINERYFSNRFTEERTKFLKNLYANYGKRERYKDVSYLIEEILNVDIDNRNIATIITRSIKMICHYLDINTPIIRSSEISQINHLKGEQRVIEINKLLHSTHYINPIGGVTLYDKENFRKQGLLLNFIKSNPIEYNQQSKEFIPWLSIIDVIMNNSVKQTKDFLNEYKLYIN